MGFSITPVKPDWKTSSPVEFVSLNPLVKDKVVLDMYMVRVIDSMKNGEVSAEHIELCVTHSSLLRWYQVNLMPNGATLRYEMCAGPKAGVVVKCILEKEVSPEEEKTLTLKGFNIPNRRIHIESFGEASGDNCFNDVAKTHQAATAENRAFDRTLIRYLSLDLTEFGVDTVYSNSESIGTPVSVEEASAEAATKPAAEPAPKAVPSWLGGTNNATPTEPATHYVQTASPSPARTMEKAPATTVKENPSPAPAKRSEEDAIEKYKEEREIATRTEFKDTEYEAMLDTPFAGPVSSELNGKPFREIIRLLRDGYDNAGKALSTYVKYRPMQAANIPVWKCLISYLAKEKLIRFYSSGKFFIGKKD